MPQSEAKFQINQFTGGLNTDANPLAEAGGTSRDELNCEILSHGGRRRRRGFSPEVGAVESSVVLTTAQKENYAFTVFDWDDVANVGGLDFAVYQEGPTLYFYDKSDASLSLGRKAFSVDLSSFKTAAASTTELQNTRVSTASGKGVLFVCGSTIEPFYIEYNTVTDTISTTQVTIQIRDFEDLDDGIGVKQEVNISETAANGEHLYNLLNQGWYQDGLYLRDGGSTNRDGYPAIELYRSVIGDFPRKNTPWYFGKYLVAEDSGQESNQFLSPQQVRSAPSGNTPSANGHYILDAFNKDRAEAVIAAGDDLRSLFAYYARIDNLDPVTEDERPVAVAFYAGRVWWALKNNIYFSQILDTDDVSAAGKCYQDGDPTSENESDVIATDGGLIPVSSMGRATALAVTGTSLIVLADNGVWAIQGAAGDSFTAVDFSVNRLSTLSCRSPESVVEAEGLVFFWGEYGVYIISPGNLSENAALEDLVEGRITEFYKSIPQASKRNSFGFYDPIEKTIYWLYKQSADEAGINTNRFAYDRLLNFSLKFSAWFPWSATVSANNQIIGGTTSGGVVTTTTDETVTDGGVAVTDSGALVTTRAFSTTEISEVPKFFCLTSGTSANVAEANSTTFTDWPNDDATDYSSYIETFYHIQDDPMAFMQAPYTFIYFRRTDEEATATTTGVVSYAQVGTGGLVSDSQFIGELYKNAPASGEDAPHLPSMSPFLIGEDGNRYGFEHGGEGTGDNENVITLYNIDTGAAVWSRTNSQINADFIAGGVEPPNGGFLTTQGALACAIIPGTAYFVVGIHQSSGVDTSSGFGYYRVPAGGTPEFVGGLSGREGDLSGVDEDAGWTGSNASSLHGIGFINGAAEDLDSGDSRYEAQRNIFHQYPLMVAWNPNATTIPRIMAMPSINQVMNGNTGNIDQEDWFIDSTEYLGTAFDDNIFDLRGHPSGGLNRQHAFFLPTASGGRVYLKWYQRDIDEHIAGSEAVTSTFLQTNDSTYSSGFISSLDIALSATGGNSAFGISTTLGSTPVVQDDSDWTGYPFTDETDDYDETAGTSTNNYTMPPACFPLYDDDIDGPWLLFFPKVFRNQSQSDKIGMKVMLFDPVTEAATLLDEGVGSIVDFSTNTTESSGHDPESVSVYWDRSNGDVFVQVFYDNSNSESIVTSKWGTFTPQISGVDFFAGEGLELIESSCLLNTRWEWSNNTVSGKVSPDIQVYRGGRLRLVTDPTDPEPTGLPVYVSKTKTRGRGRVLQLRLRSETGKDFEIYGWAVWAAKNTRF